VTVRKPPKGIISEAAYVALALTIAQARNNLIDLIAAWRELATFRKGKRSFTIIDNGLASSGANRDGKSDSKHVIGEKKK
jgi:hypothetical protein